VKKSGGKKNPCLVLKKSGGEKKTAGANDKEVRAK